MEVAGCQELRSPFRTVKASNGTNSKGLAQTAFGVLGSRYETPRLFSASLTNTTVFRLVPQSMMLDDDSSISVVSFTIADIATLATTVRTPNSSCVLSHTLFATAFDIKSSLHESHNVFLHFVIILGQDALRTEVVARSFAVWTPVWCRESRKRTWSSLQAHSCCRCCCCCCACSGRRRAVCCFLFFPCSLAPISPFLPRPFLSQALPARLSWLHATLFDGLAPWCGPLSMRIHHAFCYHFMRLLDTWLSSCTEFTSSS